MNISIAEAIQSVQSLYSKGVQSKDTRLSSRHIYSSLVTARAKVLKQQVNKRQKINDWCYQPLSCVELIEAPIHECPCAPKDGCLILRTKDKLPSPISNLDKLLIQYVVTIDGGVKLDKTEFENVKYASGNKFTSKKPKYYIKNQYLYVTIYKKLQAISMNILANDPLHVHQFPSFCGDCDDCKCKSVYDYEFPIDRDSFGDVLKLAEQELIIMFPQMREDKQANGSDDNQITGNMIHQPKG